MKRRKFTQEEKEAIKKLSAQIGSQFEDIKAFRKKSTSPLTTLAEKDSIQQTIGRIHKSIARKDSKINQIILVGLKEWNPNDVLEPKEAQS